tara:strand:- start:438 stop:1364 length:927 start_codon:yes stop_codon:yes gene_type:complete
MSYKNIQDRLNNNGIIILDGGIGGELQKLGASMDKELWAGKCTIDNPELVKKVHASYISSGADVITANTYATPPISMREHGYSEFINEWNTKGVKLAKSVAESSEQNISVAGSVSTYGSWDRLSEDELIPGFKEQIKILSDAGADFLILEAMSSALNTVETLVKCSLDTNLPVWLSISCALDKKTDKLMLGYQESIEKNTKSFLYNNFEKSIQSIEKIHKGPILIAHTDLTIINRALYELKRNFSGIIGAYPNVGYFEKPTWNFMEKEITSNQYLYEAKSWIKSGAQILGGCCGVGPSRIKAISKLKN